MHEVRTTRSTARSSSSTSTRAEFFWLDLHRPSPDEIGMLGELFALHPLAVEDVSHFGQRPKLDSYDDFMLLVAYGANADRDGLVEVHCFLSDHYLITVHRDDCPAFEELRRRTARDPAFITRGTPLLLHAVVDALVDSFFPELTKLDDRIDDVEAAMLQQPDRRAAPGDLPPQATHRRLAQDHHGTTRPVRGDRRRRRGPARHERRDRALLPRRL